MLFQYLNFLNCKFYKVLFLSIVLFNILISETSIKNSCDTFITYNHKKEGETVANFRKNVADENIFSYSIGFTFSTPVAEMKVYGKRKSFKVNNTLWYVNLTEDYKIDLVEFDFSLTYGLENDITKVTFNGEVICDIHYFDGVYGDRNDGEYTCNHYFSYVYSSYIEFTNNETISSLKFPVELQFNRPVMDLKGKSMNFHRVNSHQWRLTSFNCIERKCGFQIISNFKDIKITKFSSVICEEMREIHFETSDRNTKIFGLQPRLYSTCDNATLATQKLDPKSVLKRKGKWQTGRNFVIEISSLDTFVGYVLELYFTKPITGISGLAAGIKATKFSDTHWALTKSYTEKACIKLIEVFLSISYNEESDIEALLFNGNSVIGNQTSKVFVRNQDITHVMNSDCEKYIIKYESWFGEEIGRQSFLETKINSEETTVGVVVDFIFEKEIKGFKLWELSPEMMSRSHWRMYNEGYVVPPHGIVKFPFIVIYFDNFHTKIKGIKLNGKILCGLGTPIYYEVEGELPGEDLRQLNKSKKEDLYNTLLWSAILVGAAIAVSVGAFCWSLIRMEKEIQRRRKHLCDFPEKEPPSELKATVCENLEESIYSTVTERSNL